MKHALALTLALLASPALAQETKPGPITPGPTVDMTTPLTREDGSSIKDCPAGFIPAKDPTEATCPALTLGSAASYGVGFAVETDRQLDWKVKAELRMTVDRYRDSKAASLSEKQCLDLMDRIGNIYKLLPNGDQTIVAAMKLLTPKEYAKLSAK